MVYIKDISDIEELKPSDILGLFEETKVYRLELNIAWADKTDILKKFRETETPVIAIVDKDHRLQLTIYERELLRFLIT